MAGCLPTPNGPGWDNELGAGGAGALIALVENPGDDYKTRLLLISTVAADSQ